MVKKNETKNEFLRVALEQAVTPLKSAIVDAYCKVCGVSDLPDYDDLSLADVLDLASCVVWELEHAD